MLAVASTTFQRNLTPSGTHDDCRSTRCGRRSVRIFEGVKDKAPDAETYNYVVTQLKPVTDELQVSLPEELGLQ